jgi:hypothetical protein
LVVPSSGSTTQRQVQPSPPEAQIGLADEIRRAFHAHLQLLHLVEIPQHALAGFLRRILHDGHMGGEAKGHGDLLSVVGLAGAG